MASAFSAAVKQRRAKISLTNNSPINPTSKVGKQTEGKIISINKPTTTLKQDSRTLGRTHQSLIAEGARGTAVSQMIAGAGVEDAADGFYGHTGGLSGASALTGIASAAVDPDGVASTPAIRNRQTDQHAGVQERVVPGT